MGQEQLTSGSHVPSLFCLASFRNSPPRVGETSRSHTCPSGDLWCNVMDLLFCIQELGQVKAAALAERGQVEEQLIKAKNQARWEEVSMAGQAKQKKENTPPLPARFGTAVQ